MQKLIKRTAQAQRQAARRARAQVEQVQISNKIRTRGAVRASVAEVRQNLKDAREAQREAWELGPLAPKRDLGFNGYGVVSETLRQDWTNFGTAGPLPEIVAKRCAWAGSPKQLNLAEGDRVVVLEGPDRGKIDTIKSIKADQGTVTLETCHRALTNGMFDNPPRSISMPISIDSIRLVYPLQDPETGVTRDVIIQQLKAVRPDMRSETMTFDRWHHGNKWDRIVPTLNTVIPWPEVKAPEYQAQVADTVREQVEQRTFYYGLLSPPMPDQVLDELRNKYSHFRTRHEEWYLEQKEEEAQEKKRRHEMLQSMQTPVQELNQQRKQLREEAGEPELSEEMLAKLGELMAQKKAAVLEQAGVSEVSGKQ